MSASSWNNQSLTMGYYFPALQSLIGADSGFVASSGAVAQFESDFSITFSRVSSNVEELSFSFNTANVWAYWGQFNGFVITGPSNVAAITSVTYSTNSNFVGTDISHTTNSLSVNWAAMNYDPSTVLNLFINFVPTPPTIAITSAGVLTNQAQQVITGTVDAADAGSTVTLYDNGSSTALASAVVGADGSWSASVTLPSEGANVLVAKDSNAAGTATSNSITDTLDTIAPVVTLALADDTGVSASDHITYNDALVGTAELGAQVVIRNGTTILASVTPDAGGHWSFTPSFADGSYTLTASETDAAGNVGTAALSFTLDTHTPSVTASLVDNTGGNAAAPVTYNDQLTGTADANASVVISNGGVQVGAAVANAAGVWTAIPLGLADGAYNLTVSDTDAAGKTFAANLAFTLDTHTPAAPSGLTVASPSVVVSGSDIVALGSDVTLSGHAEAGDAVILWDGSSHIASLTADASGAWSFTETSPLIAGSHHVQAQAIDAAGKASAMSAVLTVATDRGPLAASGSDVVAYGVTTNLTSLIDGLITPGISGDGDTITAVSGCAAVSLSGGVVTYAAGNGGGSDSFSYTVQNALGQSATGTIALAIDGGPTTGNASFAIGHGQSTNVTTLLDSLIGKGLVGDTETITAVSGHAALGSGGSVTYSAPAIGGSDGFTYTVTDQLGQTSIGNVTVAVDGGPVAASTALLIGHGQSQNVTALVNGLISKGQPSDTETITAVSGHAMLSAGGAIIYSAPASGGADSFTYTVADQLGDNATGTVNVTIDPGPSAANGILGIGHGQTDDVTSLVNGLITKGEPGDTETIIGVSGHATLNSNGTISYTASGSAGSDSFTYTVQDQLGETATGTVTVTIDPGPIAATGHLTIGHGQSESVTALVDGLIGSGLVADTNAITAVSGGAVLGAGGVVTYTAPHAAGASSFSYTVANEYNQSATGLVNVTVDPGPSAANGALLAGLGKTRDVTSLLDGLISKGLPGDVETITAVSGNAMLNANGTISYAAPSSGHADSFTYTATDQYGDSSTGTVHVTLDGGPVLAAAGASFIIGHGQSETVTALVNGLISAGVAGDSETVTSVTGGAVLNGGVITYTAPNSGSSDSFGYTVTDQLGDTASGLVHVTIDPGPNAANAGLTVGHGQSVDVTALVNALVTPGLAGDSETITAVSGDAVLKNGVITYTAPASGNSDSFGYTVTDQYGDSATGTVSVAIDPGPRAGFGSQAVDQHQTINMTAYVESLITQGAPGDTETITAVSGANVALVGGQVVYASQGSGMDSFTYTVTDQYGDAATGTVDVKIDPGPITQTGLINVQAGYSVDETGYVNSLILPGMPGDTDTIIAVSGPDVVLNASGSIVYTAPSTAMNDSFTYTVENQRGDVSIGTVNVAVAHVNTVVNLQGEAGTVSAITPPPVASLANGSAVFGPLGGYALVASTTNNTTITAYGYQNTIIAGGGNDVVNAGLATANVTVSDGNGSNVVRGFVSNSSVVLLNGNNTIMLGGYTNSVTLGDGDNTINSGVGYADITVGNGNNTIAASGYANTIIVGNGDNVISTGVGNATVSISGGADRIMAVGYNNAFTLGGGTYIVSGVVGLASFTLTSSFGAGDSIDLTGFSGQFGLVGGVWTAHLPDGDVVASFTPPRGDGLSGVSDGHGGLLVSIGPLNPPPPIQPNIVETTGGQDITLLSTTHTLHLFGYNNSVTSAAGGFSISGDMGGSTFDLGAGGNTLVLSGTGDNITIGLGNNTISGTQGSATIVTGAGNQTMNASGAYNSITTGDGDSRINAGAGYATVSVGTGTNSITAGGNDNSITTAGGSSTVSLSGWNNTVIAGSGLTTVSGGYANTYIATAVSAAGGIDVMHFNANMGDVLDVMPLESLLGVSLSAFTALTDQHDAQALDIYVTAPHASTTLVATLHGAGHGATMASLLASGSLMG